MMRNLKGYIRRKVKAQVTPMLEGSSVRNVGGNETGSVVLKPALPSDTTWRFEDLEEKKQKIRLKTLGKMRRRIVPIN